MKSMFKTCGLLLLPFVISGCSLLGPSKYSQSKHSTVIHTTEASTSTNWKESGVLVLSRTAPKLSTAQNAEMLGFIPVKTTRTGHWLAINKASRSVSVMDGDQVLLSSNAEGLDALKPGTYEVIHKQRDPLWYAPDTYFSSRLLTMPPQGDRERYRKGALGDFVLYLDPELPIHSSPLWSDEVGGVRLNTTEIARLYYSVDIGSVVEIR